MNIILGASGQVGSNIVNALANKNLPVRAIVRNPTSAFGKNIEVKIANFFNQKELIEAFKGGTTVFLLTPENPLSTDIIGETSIIISNYKKAIQANEIKRIVGLSCVGAHVNNNTGNILMSGMLEKEFDDLIEVEKIFIRPSYYFSNWLNFLEVVEQQGVLPSFFPENLKIDMNSPIDVAKFIAHKIAENTKWEGKKIFELTGSQKYSSKEIADILSKLLNKRIEVFIIPKENWKETLMSAGFTKNTSDNIIDMTQAVIDKIVFPENKDYINILPTNLYDYFKEQLIRSGKISET
ncbi:NmrA family NAD(P)-binding protein [Abyssalbus ytuae]|uniref:NAD(P)H-binding protein n=1 Tax=Abyssalbus ytuae TaxID=2926907 RepID=A0A9E6ZZD4_9FLAO|nr:NmrA family NAD(P)-binding protein [Abyssalbus ytuae]UOB17962.1 NAD(P)H-binding protein [Abyssalbus ytuae]